jgi:hypothetical protein
VAGLRPALSGVSSVEYACLTQIPVWQCWGVLGESSLTKFKAEKNNASLTFEGFDDAILCCAQRVRSGRQFNL